MSVDSCSPDIKHVCGKSSKVCLQIKLVHAQTSRSFDGWSIAVYSAKLRAYEPQETWTPTTQRPNECDMFQYVHRDQRETPTRLQATKPVANGMITIHKTAR